MLLGPQFSSETISFRSGTVPTCQALWSVPDVRDDDGNESWGPRSSRSVCARYNVCAAVDERSCARRVSGAHAAPTAVAEAGMMCDLGRVASGPRQGRTGTAGAAD